MGWSPTWGVNPLANHGAPVTVRHGWLYFALSRTDLFLTRYSREDLPSLPLNAKKEWVRHLELARAAWNIERLQVQKGQRVITQFFARMSALTLGDESAT